MLKRTETTVEKKSSARPEVTATLEEVAELTDLKKNKSAPKGHVPRRS